MEGRKRLIGKGLLGINLNGTLTGPGSYLFRSIYKTLAQAFPRIYLFVSKKEQPGSMKNIIFFALKENLYLSPQQITPALSCFRKTG